MDGRKKQDGRLESCCEDLGEQKENGGIVSSPTPAAGRTEGLPPKDGGANTGSYQNTEAGGGNGGETA